MAVLAWSVAAAAAGPGQAATPSTPGLETRETPVKVIKDVKGSNWNDNQDLRWTLAVSPDGKRHAYSIHRMAGKGWLLLLPISPFVARNATEKVVVDGVEGPAFEAVAKAIFSPDSLHVAYRAAHAGKLAVGMTAVNVREMIVLDGVEGPAHKAIGHPVFSPDSRRLAYTASDPGSHCVVLDDVCGESYDDVTNPVFSPDSGRIVYMARRGRELLLVDGGQATPVHADDAYDPAFSPDGRRLAYRATRAGQSLMVVDGVEGPPWDSIGLPVFSPDGRLAYTARRGPASFLVLEGAEPRPHSGYTALGDPVFSPDGRLAYRAIDGAQQRVLLDGAADQPPYDEVGGLAFGPDGQHLAYEARSGERWRLIVDGVAGPEYTPAPRPLHTSDPWIREDAGRTAMAWSFAGPDILRYSGFRKKELVLWEARIRKAPVPVP